MLARCQHTNLRLVLAAVALMLCSGCGVSGASQVGALRHGNSASCAVGRSPEGCVRFVERTVKRRSIALTANVARQITASCAAAARVTRIEVICPPVVPAGGVINNPELYGPQLVDRRSYSISINNGQNPGHIHWEFGAIKGPATRLWVFDRSNWAGATPPKHPARLIATRRYLGHLILIYRFPDNDGQLQGHDAAFAADHGISYFVSVHGHNTADADIAMLLAILARKAWTR
jgi:hypothetical protein